MKSSYYNQKFVTGNQIYIYNTKSGGLLVTKKENEQKITSLLEAFPKAHNGEYKHIFEELEMIVPDDFDELSYIKARYWKLKHIDNTMRMMLCTTFSCNFKCDYCFEGLPKNVSHAKMDKRVQDSIFDLIVSRIHELKRINIHWFGGETLLNTEPIFYLGRKIRELSKRNDVTLIQEVITNGYLLDKDLAKKLYENEVSEIQVTFDGAKNTHDKRRFHGNHIPTFERILQNILSWQDFLTAKIRVNTDRRNIDSMFEFVDQLCEAGLNKRTRLHFGMARNFSQGTLNKNELKAEEFRKKIHPVYKYAISKGLNIDYGISLQPKITVCDAAKRNTIHVGTDGTIWKCFPLIGTSKGRCGTIFDIDSFSKSKLLYESFDPFSDEKCESCKLLPICMRRCPHEEMCLNVNDSLCDFYLLDEIKERIQLIIDSGNINNNINNIIYF